MLEEFKKFALKGNIVDLAVAVVMGAAFNAIINSFVGDILMPLLGIITGGHDLTSLQFNVGDAVVSYGKFLQFVINFVLVAFSLFMAIKAINKFKKKEEEAPAAPAAPSKEEILLAEIRDLLKK